VLQAEAVLANAQMDLMLRWPPPISTCSSRRTTWRSRRRRKSAISEQLAQAKRNFEVGTATIVDTLEAQARYDQSTAKEVVDKNDLEVRRRALQVLLGKIPDGLTPLREPLELSLPQPNDIEAWVKAATDSSFTIAIARANVEIAKEEGGPPARGALSDPRT
jgi:outer membrane protein